MATPGNVRNRTYIADARGQTGVMENSRQHDWTEAAGGFVIVLSMGWRISDAAAAHSLVVTTMCSKRFEGGESLCTRRFPRLSLGLRRMWLGAVSIALAFPRLPVRSNALRPDS
jgi:hypothetical protein